MRFRFVENGEDVGPHYVELQEVDFLVTSAAKKNVVIRYRDEVYLLPVRIILLSAEDRVELVEFIQSIGATVLQCFVEEALLNQRDNPRTGRIEPRQSPHTILPPPNPADEEGESSMDG